MANTSQSVIIVGAGIAGLSTSFHLADKGVRKILLLDKGRVGDGSSSRSGAINTMMMATEGASRARGVTFDIFERFDKILDNYDFHQVGCLNLLDPQQFERARRLHPMHRRAGARFLVLRRRQQIEEQIPRSPDSVKMNTACWTCAAVTASRTATFPLSAPRSGIWVWRSGKA